MAIDQLADYLRFPLYMFFHYQFVHRPELLRCILKMFTLLVPFHNIHRYSLAHYPFRILYQSGTVFSPFLYDYLPLHLYIFLHYFILLSNSLVLLLLLLIRLINFILFLIIYFPIIHLFPLT